MPSSSITWEQCREWADAAAADFLMLDPKDLPAMAHFVKRLEQQAADMAAFTGSPIDGARMTDSLSQAATRLKAVILKDEPDPPGAMEAVSQAIESIQTAAQAAEGRDQTEMEAATPTSTSSLSPAVDASIISAYVEQQAGVLPELESLILAFEKSRETGLLSEVRRIIHTLKGESGVVGAIPIEKMCHQMEDYLDGPVDSLLPETLLTALDWMNNAIRAFGEGQLDKGKIVLLDQLDSPPDRELINTATPASTPEPDHATPFSPPAPLADATPQSIPVGDRELALDFSVEAQEHFEAADENLLILEREPGNSDAIGAVFRAFHTIKGVAGFLGLPPIGDLAHAAETLLDDVRKGRRSFDGAVVEVTFNALDALKTVVEDLRQAAAAGNDLPIRPNHPTVIEALKAVLAGEPMPTTTGSPEPSAATVDQPAEALSAENAPPPPPAATQGEAAPKRVAESAQTMKVDAARIDLLLDTIGELVIAESIVAGDPDIRALKSVRVEKSLALLGKITRTLQDMGMSMRLVPVDPVFRKMTRLVRDLSKKSGKRVDLTIEGGDTEIDKSMVEKLGDPLVHMIRNSMDHGLEPSEERLANGKPETGHIKLRAYHQGGNIHIEIEDDGRGLDRKAILGKAIERGLLTSGDGLSDQDVFSLIFQAGFSTAKQVTEISGRGVGMDVVRRNIEALRGNVLIRSTPGQGSVFTLALPLTTAIIDGMLARLGNETYIVPTLSILESFRPAPGLVHSITGKGEVVSFRGNLLPLFRLSRLLGLSGATEDPLRAIVMVVEEFGKHWGFMVDDILGKQQVVIKSLGEGMGSVPGIAGASILADGRPGLILDVGGVIRLATQESG